MGRHSKGESCMPDILSPLDEFQRPAELAAYLCGQDPATTDWSSVAERAADMDKAGLEGAAMLSVLALQQVLTVNSLQSPAQPASHGEDSLLRAVAPISQATAHLKGTAADAQNDIAAASRRLESNVSDALGPLKAVAASLEASTDPRTIIALENIASTLAQALSPGRLGDLKMSADRLYAASQATNQRGYY